MELPSGRRFPLQRDGRKPEKANYSFTTVIGPVRVIATVAALSARRARILRPAAGLLRGRADQCDSCRLCAQKIEEARFSFNAACRRAIQRDRSFPRQPGPRSAAARPPSAIERRLSGPLWLGAIAAGKSEPVQPIRSKLLEVGAEVSDSALAGQRYDYSGTHHPHPR
jgi:hypothetical protein